jgi:hypothetical protein
MKRSVHKFGYNADVDTTTDPEDVWDAGGLYAFPSAAAETSIVSSAGADDLASTGARTVRVEGLDANYQVITEDVEMDGATPVVLSAEFLRVYRAQVLTAGSGGINAGAIDVKHGATVLARIGIGNGQTLMAIYTVPKLDYDGHPVEGAVLREFGVGLQKGGALGTFVSGSLKARVEGGVFQIKHYFGVMTGASPTIIAPKVAVEFAAGSDIRVELTETSADDVAVDAWFDLELF